MTSDQMKILRGQDRTEKELHVHRQLYGDKATEILVSGMMVGIQSYLTKVYDTRRAYDAFQQLADCIAEEEIK